MSTIRGRDHIIQFDNAGQLVKAVLVAHGNPQFLQHPVDATKLLDQRRLGDAKQSACRYRSAMVASGAFMHVVGL